MASHPLNLLRGSTTDPAFLPWSHRLDAGHAPSLEVRAAGNTVVLGGEDVYKLKPNTQVKPKDRIDIYLPKESALGLAYDIESFTGTGHLAELAGVDPEGARMGSQLLPKMSGNSYRVAHVGVELGVAGRTLGTTVGDDFYVDLEAPQNIHREMAKLGRAVHLGIRNLSLGGVLDPAEIRRVNVPESELRGENNPVRKAKGTFRLVLAPGQARSLAATFRDLAARI